MHNVIRSCSQTLYALKVLRAHGMSDSVLQSVYRAVVISKLMYGSCACIVGQDPANDSE